MSYARCFEVDNEKMLERIEQRESHVPYTYYNFNDFKRETKNIFEKKVNDGHDRVK